MQGRWKLVRHLSNRHGDFTKAAIEAVRTQFELYDLLKDQGETRDLTSIESRINDDLKREHVEWLRSAGAQ